MIEIRGKLLEAAARVFAETGYRGATTRRIAQEAGVNEVTLFRHFGSKGELIQEALQGFGWSPPGPDLPAEPVDPERELTDWARRHLRHLWEVRSFILSALGESVEHADLASCVSERRREIVGQVRSYVSRLAERGFTSGDFDPVVASAMLLGTLFSDAVGREFMPELYQATLDDAAAAYVKLFLKSIGLQVRLASPESAVKSA